MVKALLAAYLCLSASVAPSALAPAPVSPSASTDLSTTAKLEAKALQAFEPEPNHPIEDFFTVSLISLPFTALWSFIGATAVASVTQQKFPPEYTDNLFIGAASAAAGLSLGIGLVSISWGPGKGKAAQTGP